MNSPRAAPAIRQDPIATSAGGAPLGASGGEPREAGHAEVELGCVPDGDGGTLPPRWGQRPAEALGRVQEQSRDDAGEHCERKLEQQPEQEGWLERRGERETTVVNEPLKVLLHDEGDRRQEREEPGRPPAAPSTTGGERVQRASCDHRPQQAEPKSGRCSR